MYHLTGLPGWMRFGFSPGWIGRSPTGLGPCASFLLTGQWPTPQMQAWWQGMRTFALGYNVPQQAPQDELRFLKEQARQLQGELEAINRRIRELEEGNSS
jgi:hypothetical protein